MRALRIGVVLRDVLVEEKIVTGAVSFGQSLRCTVSVPVEGVPHDHVLVTRDGVLQQVPKMELKAIGVDAGVIGMGARGKVRIGDVTILFQEVAVVAPQPRPRLPASVRGTFADRIDRRLAAIVGASLVAHIGIAAWAFSADAEVAEWLSPQVARTYVPDTIDVALPDHVIDLTPTQGAAIPARPVVPPVPTRIVATPHRDPLPPTHDDATRMAAILTSPDSNAGGPGEMARRQPGADLDKQLEEARSRHITIGQSDHASRADDHAALGTDHGPQLDDPTLTRHVRRAESTLPPITLGPAHTEEPWFTPDAVLDKIRTAYMPGLQRCYLAGLRGDDTLSGKVSLTFTISVNGRVIDPSATGVTSAVDECVESLMSLWRFAIPRDKSGEPTDVTLHLVLALRPS